MPAVARRLSELNSQNYTPLEALGICTIDAGSQDIIPALADLYSSLGKQVLAVCDKQESASQAKIESNVEKLFMHSEKGFENLVLKNTSQAAMIRFIDTISWPTHLNSKFPAPKTDPQNALSEYFQWSKGNGSIADFLVQCDESEVPDWIKETCRDIKALVDPIVPNVVT
jgi:putative ATP-dependent endonuclease of OLD family